MDFSFKYQPSDDDLTNFNSGINTFLEELKTPKCSLQTYQILTNDDQMLNLCFSYSITTVQLNFYQTEL